MNTREYMLDNIPKRISLGGKFCIWKYEEVDGRPTKVLYQPENEGKRARSNDVSTFSTLARARGAWRKNEKYDGVGLLISKEITDGVSAIDIDHCIDEDGVINDLALDIIRTMDSYTEKSPSGHGVRILFNAGGLEYDREKYYIMNHARGLEIYVSGVTNKFVSLTGDALRKVETFDSKEEALSIVLEKYMRRPEKKTSSVSTPGRPLDISDEDLIQKACEKSSKFERLWSGDLSDYRTIDADGRVHEDHSAGDLALCGLLMWWTNGDRARVERLFENSGLMRDKWRREDYRRSTLDRVSFTGGYDPTYYDASLPSLETYEEPSDYYEEDYEVQEVENESQVQEVKEAPPKSGVDFLDEFYNTVQTKVFKPIPTGIPSIDKVTGGGFMRKTLVTLGSAPGMGKTAIAQYILENMAKAGHDVLYFNLEMDRSQLYARSIARTAHIYRNNINYDGSLTAVDIMRGYEWNEERRRVVKYALDKYRETIAPHFIYNPGEDLEKNKLSHILEASEQEVKRLKALGRPAPLVCVDYLQIIEYDMEEDGKKVDSVEGIKKTLVKLKSFAIENDTVVFLIVAHSRDANKKGKGTMESSRDTSNIEYSGDLMFTFSYTAVEDGEKYPRSWKRNENGELTYNKVTREYIDTIIENTPEDKPLPLVARRKCLKITKSRMSSPGMKARFIFDGSHFSFEADMRRVYKKDAYLTPLNGETEEEYKERISHEFEEDYDFDLEEE